jgi:hypothetical protein
MNSLCKFFGETIKGSKYSNLIMGIRAHLDANVLKHPGNLKDLKLVEIFGF